MGPGIAARYAEVRRSVAEACRSAGRDPEDVRIIGVTKYVGVDEARILHQAGCADLGESRPQELWRKAEAFTAEGLRPRWHLIGHLQRNKIRRTLACGPLIHSLDSPRLLEALDRESTDLGVVTEALVEVNLDGGPGRTGVAVDAVRGLVETARSCPGIALRGLMGMASAPDDGQSGDVAGARARRQFATLREILQGMTEDGLAPASMTELSMGMSGDWREAVIEGATLLRIGSALFEDPPAA